MQSCAGKARNGFARPILKLANLGQLLRVIAVARVNSGESGCVLPPAILGDCLVVGGRRAFCAASLEPSNVGTRSTKRDSYLCRGRCAMLSAFLQLEWYWYSRAQGLKIVSFTNNVIAHHQFPLYSMFKKFPYISKHGWLCTSLDYR